MNRQHLTFLLALLLILSLFLNPMMHAASPLTLTVTSSEAFISPTSMSVLSFQFAGQQAEIIRRIRLDASALGYEKLITIDLELLVYCCPSGSWYLDGIFC